MLAKALLTSHSKMSDSSWVTIPSWLSRPLKLFFCIILPYIPHELGPTRILRPWGFPGKSTGMGCHFLLQGIFPTQGSNPGLPHCRQLLYHLSHQGNPSLYSCHFFLISSASSRSLLFLSSIVPIFAWKADYVPSKFMYWNSHLIASECIWR